MSAKTPNISFKLKRGQYQRLVLTALLVGLCQAGRAQEAPGARPSIPSGGAVTLFQNVRVFDGKSDTLSGPRNVLVRGNKIERISTDPIPTDRSAHHRAHRRRRAHADARADRHALAHDAGAADARSSCSRATSATSTWWQAPRLRTR